jgi:hypothetical protein
MSAKGITTVKGQKWGCNRCAASGDAKNAMAVAAQHHKKTNHPTWSEQTMRTEYGAGPSRRAASEQRSML